MISPLIYMKSARPENVNLYTGNEQYEYILYAGVIFGIDDHEKSAPSASKTCIGGYHLNFNQYVTSKAEKQHTIQIVSVIQDPVQQPLPGPTSLTLESCPAQFDPYTTGAIAVAILIDKPPIRRNPWSNSVTAAYGLAACQILRLQKRLDIGGSCVTYREITLQDIL